MYPQDEAKEEEDAEKEAPELDERQKEKIRHAYKTPSSTCLFVHPNTQVGAGRRGAFYAEISVKFCSLLIGNGFIHKEYICPFTLLSLLMKAEANDHLRFGTLFVTFPKTQIILLTISLFLFTKSPSNFFGVR